MTALGVGVGEEEKENGIRITNIYPGEVNTDILDQRKMPLINLTDPQFYSL